MNTDIFIVVTVMTNMSTWQLCHYCQKPVYRGVKDAFRVDLTDLLLLTMVWIYGNEFLLDEPKYFDSIDSNDGYVNMS